MPVRIKTDLEFGQSMYLKADPVQTEYTLVGVVVRPGNPLLFRLAYMEDEIEVYDFQVSTTRDELKRLEGKDDDE